MRNHSTLLGVAFVILSALFPSVEAAGVDHGIPPNCSQVCSPPFVQRGSMSFTCTYTCPTDPNAPAARPSDSTWGGSSQPSGEGRTTVTATGTLDKDSRPTGSIYAVRSSSGAVRLGVRTDTTKLYVNGAARDPGTLKNFVGRQLTAIVDQGPLEKFGDEFIAPLVTVRLTLP